MLERLWTSILELMAQVVTPDWGVLVSLIPVGIASSWSSSSCCGCS